MEVGPELVREGVGGGVAKLGGGGVEGSDGGGCVVGFEEEAVGGTEAQAVGIVTEAEADVEAVVQELLQLLGLVELPLELLKQKAISLLSWKHPVIIKLMLLKKLELLLVLV